MLGSGVGQYRVKSDGSCAPHGEDGAFRQRRDMQEQCAMAAISQPPLRSSDFSPAWLRQQVFVAVPTTGNTGKEWRLCSRVVSFGELMLALGHAHTSHDIELFWQSMTIATEKRQVKEFARKKKGNAQEQ